MQNYTSPMFPAIQEQTPTASPHSQHHSESLLSSSIYNTDEWFRDEFDRLYNEVVNFVDMFFCTTGDISLKKSPSPWTEMPPQFVRYSMMVAEPDESPGDWDRILLKSKERRYLLVGIVSRVLEARVFGELLFGASKGQKRLLEDLERSSTEVEGFSRTESRASNVSAMLVNGPTPNFDIDVTRLSTQIMMLFQPLNKFLEDVAACEKRSAPSNEDQFKSIYNIVATAAYLSMRVRTSPTIFYFHPERPGNLYDPDDQTNVDHSAYVASKSAVTGVQDSRCSQLKRYRALVRFALWPSIKRYSAGIGNRGDEISGFRVYNISNSRVVYYWGLEDCGNRVSMDLQAFIEQRRKKHRSRVINVANDTVRVLSAMVGRAMELMSWYRLAVVLAVSAYLIARDFAQGKDPFRWQ